MTKSRIPPNDPSKPPQGTHGHQQTKVSKVMQDISRKTENVAHRVIAKRASLIGIYQKEFRATKDPMHGPMKHPAQQTRKATKKLAGD